MPLGEWGIVTSFNYRPRRITSAGCRVKEWHCWLRFAGRAEFTQRGNRQDGRYCRRTFRFSGILRGVVDYQRFGTSAPTSSAKVFLDCFTVEDGANVLPEN